MLLGFGLVALPLLIAIVNAAVQIRRLAERKRDAGRARRAGDALQPVAVRADRLARAQCAPLPGASRDRELLEIYRQNHERFQDTLEALGKLNHDAGSDARLQMLRTESVAIRRTLTNSAPRSSQLLQAVGNFSRLWETATALAETSRRQIDEQLGDAAACDRAKRSEACSGRPRR